MDPVTAPRNEPISLSSPHSVRTPSPQGIVSHKDSVESMEESQKKSGCIGCSLMTKFINIKNLLKRALNFFLSFFSKPRKENKTVTAVPPNLVEPLAQAIEEPALQTPPATLTLPELTATMQEDTRFIITTLATAPLYNVPQQQLRERGRALEASHPLAYLAYIASDVELSCHLKTLKERSFGIFWTRYNNEFCKRLQDYNRQSPFLPYVPAFAEKVGLSQALITSLIEREEFLQLMVALADRTPQAPTRIVAEQEEIIAQASPAIEPQATEQQATEPQTTTPSSLQKTLDDIALNDAMKASLILVLDKVANLSTFSLTMQAAEIKKEWKKLNQAHPLAIIDTIFSSDVLKTHLQKIFTSTLRKDPFLNDLSQALISSKDEDYVSYIPLLADKLKVDPLVITSLTVTKEKNEWKKLIVYLLQQIAARA